MGIRMDVKEELKLLRKFTKKIAGGGGGVGVFGLGLFGLGVVSGWM